MRIKNAKQRSLGTLTVGFTLMEILVAMTIIGFVFIALYAGLASGVSVTQMTRENLRATQILLEKAETFRLYSWTQITTKDWVPDSFTNTYCPNAPTNAQGAVYIGSIDISKPSLTANYKDDMRQIDMTLQWKTGSLKRSRTMTIYVARNGMQNYTY